MILRSILYVFLLTYSFNLFATNIRVLNLQSVIDNNQSVENLISMIENDQKKYVQDFRKKEADFQLKLKKIEELELILDPAALEKEISKYNKELKDFNLEVQNFNTHYDAQMNTLKSNILDVTLEKLKKYSLDNQIDLILDSNNYILSNNSIDITNILLEEINKTEFNISFEKFK